MSRAFFLDRDGTLNVDYNYVHTPDEWTWCEGAVDALQWIQDHNFKIIIVTNQSGIARGRYTEQQVQDLHAWVDEQLAAENITINQWLYAPHHPEHDIEERYKSEDRKPGTGMFKKAAQKFDIDFSRSFMAGDKITDLQPAVELDITPLFLRSRHAPNQDKDWLRQNNIPTYNSLRQAVQQLKQKMT